MEDTIQMEKDNEDGKKIVKEIPINLTSLYKNQGWKETKEKKTDLKNDTINIK